MSDDPWRFTPLLEAAFGADIDDDPATWTWTDITGRVRTAAPVFNISRGRRSAGSQVAEPASLPLRLDDGDGELTYGNPNSSWFPNVVEGLPVRLSFAHGDPVLPLTGLAGSLASTPDNAALDITGDIAVAVTFDAPVGTGTLFDIAGKADSTGDEISWFLSLDSLDRPVFSWTTDGSFGTLATATSALRMPSPDAGPMTLAVELDVDNGGDLTVQFYAGRGGIDDLLANLAGSTFGEELVGSGTTSVFASSSPLEVGEVPGIGSFPYPGGVREFRLFDGLLATGTEVANPDWSAADAGDTALTDAAGRSWTFPALSNQRTRFTGTLSSMRQRHPGAGVAAATYVDWELAGPLRSLRLNERFESVLRRYITANAAAFGVTGYWPGEDGEQATSVAAAIEGAIPGRVTGAAFATDSSYPSSSPLPQVTSGEFSWLFQVPRTSSSVWQVNFFVNIPEPAVSPAVTNLCFVNTSGIARLWVIDINDTQWRVRAVDTVSGSTLLDTTGGVDSTMFGNWMIVSLGVEQDGVDVDWSLYLVPIVSFENAAFGTSGTISTATCGRPLRFGASKQDAPPAGISFGHWVVATGAALGWLARVDTAYEGEPSAERVYRLCGEEDIPVTIDGVSGFDWDAVLKERGGCGSQMGPQLPGTLLDLLEECALASQGILVESRTRLGLVFRDGRSLETQPAQFDGADIIKAGNELEVERDDRLVANDVTVSRRDGSSARAVADSFGVTGRRADARDVNVQDLRLPDHASWWLHTATSPDPRYPAPQFDLTKSDLVLGQWLDSNLGDVFTLSDLPATHWPATVRLLVDGFTERVTPWEWEATFNASPAGPWDVIGERDDTARRDTAGSALTSTVASSATTFNVTTVTGPLWTVESADRPFDIVVGGERMTVTAVSGSSSPQAVQVTRSVNSVVKSHAAGADVRLWAPTIRAL